MRRRLRSHGTLTRETLHMSHPFRTDSWQVMRRGLKRSADDGDISETDSINSRTVQLPLPENLDFLAAEADEIDAAFGSAGNIDFDDYSVGSPADPAAGLSETPSLLSKQESVNLKALIDDTCLAVKPTFKFQMPWERRRLAPIFSRDPKQLIPTPVMTPVELPKTQGEISAYTSYQCGKAPRGCFSEVINFEVDMTEQEVEETSMMKALEKWYYVFASGRGAWPRGFDFRRAVREHRLEDMKVVFGNRSFGTILRRGNSMVQFVKWYRTQFFNLCPFPLSTPLVDEFLQHLIKEGKPASNLRGFVEAINFCKHVVGMDVGMDGCELISAKARRIIEIQDSKRKEKTQARVLTVGEVEFMETFLSDERADLTDRVACGCMLFCFYSRSRWSDIRKIYNFSPDINESNGKISGYLECRTRSHKTARQVAKGGLSMPLVAPVWGVTSPPWGLAFSKVCKLALRDLEGLDHEPLLAAPKVNGEWSSRSVTTKEAGKWIRNILLSFDSQTKFTTIHTLKSTPLSWCAKWGLDPETRALLGHHATGRGSVECYSRDVLAQPLRDFETVLERIRTKSFSPDSTRSGMVKEPTVTDPRSEFKFAPETREETEIDSAESSSSSSTSDTESADAEEVTAEDPVVAPRQWDPDVEMYRNRKSLIVHVVAVGGAETFSCGVRISQDFEHIDKSPFLDLRRCKRCAVAKPIKTVGQMASGFEKLRLEAAEKGASAEVSRCGGQVSQPETLTCKLSSDTTS